MNHTEEIAKIYAEAYRKHIKPSLEKLAEAKECLDRLYNKEPSDELLAIMSEAEDARDEGVKND